MKKIIYAIVVILISSMVTASPSDKLVKALIKVESNGNVNAIGDKGKAVGVLQIWKIVVDDVNKTSSVKYSYDDRKNRTKSIEICKKYLDKYGKSYTKKTGKIPTNEVYARMWNGGPSGYRKIATKGYWNKVSMYL